MKILKKLLRHKFILFIIIVLLAGGGYFLNKNLKKDDSSTKYVLSQAEKGNIITSVSGTGQVQTVDQTDIKAKAADDLTYLGVSVGQNVTAGRVIAKINTTDAEKAVEDAQVALDQEKLNLQQMQGMQTDSGTIRGIKEKAQDSLNNDYESSYNQLSTIFLNLPTVINGLHDILYSNSFTPAQKNIDYYANPILGYDAAGASGYRNAANNTYQAAKAVYDQNLSDYQAINSSASQATIDSLLTETSQTLKNISDALKAANNLSSFYRQTLDNKNITPQALSATQSSSLNSYTSQVNGYISNISSEQNTIESDREALAQTDTTISNEEKKVADDQSALDDAQSKLADYTITSPYDGVISAVPVKQGDSVSVGETLATVVSNEEVAKITLNEVDFVKIKVGQKVNMTFDAIDGLNLTGTVAEIDTVGTVSQGVVDYGVQISFDTQDPRVKPGMSVTADIITSVNQDVLTVPTSAIHTSGTTKYVEVPATTSEINSSDLNSSSGVALSQAPVDKVIETGSSDDTNTEVTSGLSEGDIIITRTITSLSQSTSQSSSGSRSILQTVSGGGGAARTGGGGQFFISR